MRVIIGLTMLLLGALSLYAVRMSTRRIAPIVIEKLPDVGLCCSAYPSPYGVAR